MRPLVTDVELLLWGGGVSPLRTRWW